MLSFIHLLSSILVSILVWFVIGMILFGPGIGIVGTDLFGPVNAPVSKLLLAALAAGVIQGSLLHGLILRYQPETSFSFCFYSFVATEIFLVLAFFSGLLLVYSRKDLPSGMAPTSYGYEDVFRFIFIIVFWYAAASVALLLPSIVIGFSASRVRHLFQSTT